MAIVLSPIECSSSGSCRGSCPECATEGMRQVRKSWTGATFVRQLSIDRCGGQASQIVTDSCRLKPTPVGLRPQHFHEQYS